MLQDYEYIPESVKLEYQREMENIESFTNHPADLTAGTLGHFLLTKINRLYLEQSVPFSLERTAPDKFDLHIMQKTTPGENYYERMRRHYIYNERGLSVRRLMERLEKYTFAKRIDGFAAKFSPPKDPLPLDQQVEDALRSKMWNFVQSKSPELCGVSELRPNFANFAKFIHGRTSHLIHVQKELVTNKDEEILTLVDDWVFPQDCHQKALVKLSENFHHPHAQVSSDSH